MGRTRAELRETLDAAEWDDWLRFHAECDLPDGFLVTGQLGALVASVAGTKTSPADFAPYYTDPRVRKRGSLDAAFAFLKENVKHS